MRPVTEEQRSPRLSLALPEGRCGMSRSAALLVGYSPQRGCALLAPCRSAHFAPRGVGYPTVWSVGLQPFAIPGRATVG